MHVLALASLLHHPGLEALQGQHRFSGQETGGRRGQGKGGMARKGQARGNRVEAFGPDLTLLPQPTQPPCCFSVLYN